jgi:hypothetical protein
VQIPAVQTSPDVQQSVAVVQDPAIVSNGSRTLVWKSNATHHHHQNKVAQEISRSHQYTKIQTSSIMRRHSDKCHHPLHKLVALGKYRPNKCYPWYSMLTCWCKSCLASRKLVLVGVEPCKRHPSKRRSRYNMSICWCKPCLREHKPEVSRIHLPSTKIRCCSTSTCLCKSFRPRHMAGVFSCMFPLYTRSPPCSISTTCRILLSDISTNFSTVSLE